MSDIRPQARNANRHTQRGMQALENSIATDGWIGAITVAADGETFDGSARVEKTAENGMLDEAIVIDSDGTRPIVVRRTDIPTATDERAVRLGIAANRVASLNLEWEPDVLSGIADQGIDLSSLFTADEWADVAMPSLPEAGAGGDEFDPTPEDGPTRTALGELWSIGGGKHRLLVGDCTDAANVARLMGGERAGAVVTDVPYEISQVSNGLRRLDYGEWDKEGATGIALAAIGLCSDIPTITAFCGDEQLSLLLSQWSGRTKRTVAWVKPNPTVINGEHVFLPAIELAAHGRKAGAWFGGHCVRSVWEGTAPQERDHPNQKPIALFEWLIVNTCGPNDIAYDPFGGSGTLLVAAHRTNRRAYLMEIAPRYADVILRRAEAEGLECERVDD